MASARPLPIDGHFMEAESKLADALTGLAQGKTAQEVADTVQAEIAEIYED